MDIITYLSLVRILESGSLGGGKRSVHYFGIGVRQCADRVIFPVGGMSGRLGEFLSPSLEIDPLELCHKSAGLQVLVPKTSVHRRHGQFEETTGRPTSTSATFMRDSLNSNLPHTADGGACLSRLPPAARPLKQATTVNYRVSTFKCGFIGGLLGLGGGMGSN